MRQVGLFEHQDLKELQNGIPDVRYSGKVERRRRRIPDAGDVWMEWRRRKNFQMRGDVRMEWRRMKNFRMRYVRMECWRRRIFGCGRRPGGMAARGIPDAMDVRVE